MTIKVTLNVLIIILNVSEESINAKGVVRYRDEMDSSANAAE